ncbi:MULTISPECIES: hypothetical protein [unclassified Pseudomonas]|uniref:hypothetical protein n=1 Tax=unclassified Pseudomonas TaxID=196821 RepID=UPI002AC91673|nr:MULTISPECIES: hypothetical protein [unclassified Pseudomonas]MEB0039521.1 hypothetical protein [Pseudomonas sp. MH10]MEB0076984.1 hypothetical protein [Pseudomonas sp. MH10out]MEB0089786.1 hypothetical protein [Pseudomonas sp. CCI4.2]MEB0102392.1 hypothetical protein [Pseudomonas sp. CCI3.2]MEB0121484.1 hypothetical protein [Pseudomonas sp. CCI1.2]
MLSVTTEQMGEVDIRRLMQAMLLQAQEMQTALCLFDIIGGASPDSIRFAQDIQRFCDNTGNTGLQYGASYYPFINPTVMQRAEVNGTRIRQDGVILTTKRKNKISRQNYRTGQNRTLTA